jgi:hypothetical protein
MNISVFFAALLETLFQPIPSELIFPIIGYTAQTKGLGIEIALIVSFSLCSNSRNFLHNITWFRFLALSVHKQSKTKNQRLYK